MSNKKIVLLNSEDLTFLLFSKKAKQEEVCIQVRRRELLLHYHNPFLNCI